MNTCIKCQIELIVENTAIENPIYCHNCVPEVIVHESVVTKETENFSLLEDTLILKKSEAKHITFDGKAWIDNLNNAISSKTDLELRHIIEIQRAQIHFIENHLISRLIKRTPRANSLASPSSPPMTSSFTPNKKSRTLSLEAKVKKFTLLLESQGITGDKQLKLVELFRQKQQGA